MISEGENLPQKMLPVPIIPLPSLVTTEASEADGWTEIDNEQRADPALGEMRMRGNEEWAPPRRQIIFHLHPRKTDKRKALTAQKFRCAGCGLTVELNYVQRFRYCNYLGKYFCHSCHGNSDSIVPAHVLWKWDFKRLPISNFARELLEDIRTDPLYDLTAVRSCQGMLSCGSYLLRRGFIPVF